MARYRRITMLSGARRVARSQETVYFPLPGLLAEGQYLALYPAQCSLSLLTITHGMPCLLGQEILPLTEMLIARPLLACYPAQCPIAHLLAGFTYGHVTEETERSARIALLRAEGTPSWDTLIRPMRNALSRTRKRLERTFHITVLTILQQGYILHAYQHGTTPERTRHARVRHHTR